MHADQVLGVLGVQHRLGVGGCVVQGSAGGGNIQFHQLFHAFEGLVGQANEGFQVSFVCSQDLIRGQCHFLAPFSQSNIQGQDPDAGLHP
ncbi:hypothetical protein D3C72_1888530 [compost metagenome]